MKLLQPYNTPVDDHRVQISATQGSQFAKQVAGDYNPIHDPESSRFCVPGDLLFALALSRYGARQSMQFQFLELIAGDSVLTFPVLGDDGGAVDIVNDRNKPVMAMQAGGDVIRDTDKIEAIVQEYVAFSGHNFPHILLPLIQQHNVMVNPKRPLVIYERMAFELAHTNFQTLTLELTNSQLDIEGKRGRATLEFEFKDKDKVIGAGSKALLLSGLRPYDADVMNKVRDDYLARVAADRAD
ncbi:hypothetical protein GCM10008090_23590 [Arenicella chitinivorans]|uniref:DUF3581 family protein n=1 Tax=Arenicella chitinivorans TaxID=1329800 RepID=A0A918RXL1_9GAMM|nr:DUF3581 family protein [Arenicella chitinivorans]GHA13150.1 hypothetical protein GCM10008090_23590 [Arenicella chitinivorans]